MSHTFDSGLTGPMRTLIANAIVTKLTPLLAPGLGGAADGFLESIVVIGFGVDKHDELALELLASEIGTRTPIVAIAPRGMKTRAAVAGVGVALGDLEIDVLVQSRHLRNATEGRATTDVVAAATDTADPGVWAILELVWQRLYDVDLAVGTKVHQLKLDDEFELSTTPEITLWKQTWKIAVDRNANMYRGLTQKMTNAHTTLKQSAPTDEPVSKRIVEDTVVG